MKTHLTPYKTIMANTLKIKHITYFCFTILMLSLTACSDNDQSSSGASTQAKITNGNALMFMAGTQTSQQSIANSSSGSADSSKGGPASTILGLFTPNSGSADSSTTSPPSAFGLIAILKRQSCGGSYAVTNNSIPPNLDISITFTDFCIDDIIEKLSLNGAISIIANAPEFTISFIDLSISGDDISETLNCAIAINMATGDVSSNTCSMLGNGTGSSTSPTESSDENGISIRGDNTVGFTIEGRIENDDDEYVTLSTPEPLFFDFVACGAKPIAGIIQIEGSEDSRATANFSDGDNDCGTIEFCVFEDSDDEGSCTPQISL